MFLHGSVILFTGGEGVVVFQHALVAGQGVVSQVSRPTPRGEVEGSGQGRGSPGQHPGGFRADTWGLQAHTQGRGVSSPTPGAYPSMH